MSDEQKSFEILISAKAQLSGALQMRKQLEEQIVQAKQLGQSYGDQEEQLKNVNRQIELYKEAGVEATGEVEHLGASHHALHKIMHLIGHETAPELGHALGAAMMGPLGAVLAAGYAFEFLTSRIDAAIERVAKLEGTNFEAGITSLKNFQTAMDEFHRAMEKAGKSPDPFKDKLDAQKAVLQDQIKAHKAILKAMEAEDLAAVKGDPDKESAVHKRYENLNRTVDTSEQNAQIKLTAEDIKARQAAQDALSLKALNANLVIKNAENDPALIAAKAATEGKDRTALVSDFGKSINLEGAAQSMGILAPLFGALAGLKRDKASINLADFDKNKGVIDESEADITKKKAIASDASAAAVKNREAIRDEEKALGKERTSVHVEEAARQIALALGIMARGGPQTPTEARELTLIGQEVNGGPNHPLGRTSEEALQNAEKMFNRLEKHPELMDAFIQRLSGTIDKMTDNYAAAYQATIQRFEGMLQKQRAELIQVIQNTKNR